MINALYTRQPRRTIDLYKADIPGDSATVVILYSIYDIPT